MHLNANEIQTLLQKPLESLGRSKVSNPEYQAPDARVTSVQSEITRGDYAHCVSVYESCVAKAMPAKLLVKNKKGFYEIKRENLR